MKFYDISTDELISFSDKIICLYDECPNEHDPHMIILELSKRYKASLEALENLAKAATLSDLAFSPANIKARQLIEKLK